MAALKLIYPVSTVQPNSRVCRPCMTFLREPTAFDSVAHGDVACVAEESKKENLDARERYVMKPYETTLEPE